MQQQDRLAVAEGDIALNLINVYRSLGGGWELRLQKDHPDGEHPTHAAMPGMPSAVTGRTRPGFVTGTITRVSARPSTLGRPVTPAWRSFGRLASDDGHTVWENGPHEKPGKNVASLSTWETVKNTGFLRKTVAENYGRRSQIAKNLGKSAILAC